MTQKIANILTIGLWKRPQRWWRSHPKFTIAFVLGEIVAIIAYLRYAEARNNRILTTTWHDQTVAFEHEIAADPVKWYIEMGLTPYSHEEKNAFRTRYQQFEDYSDPQIEKLFEAKKSEAF